MRRFETGVEDAEFAVEGPDGWLVVGEFEDIVAELGEIYEIEYDETARAMPWLDTDDGVIRIDVRETLLDLTYDEEFVGLLADTPADQRRSFFTEMMRRIWDGKGQLDGETGDAGTTTRRQ